MMICPNLNPQGILREAPLMKVSYWRESPIVNDNKEDNLFSCPSDKFLLNESMFCDCISIQFHIAIDV